MATNCTTCGHKPTGLAGDATLGTVTYFLIGHYGPLKYQEQICATCQTFLNIAIHKHIESTKKLRNKTLAAGKPL